MNSTKNKTNSIPEYDYLKASSAQDCTGLIPAMPKEKEEIENYEELYPFLPPIVSAKDSKSKN